MPLSEKNQLHFLFSEDQRSPVGSAFQAGQFLAELGSRRRSCSASAAAALWLSASPQPGSCGPRGCGRCRKRERLAPKVTQLTSFCESLTRAQRHHCSQHTHSSLRYWGLNLASVNVECLCFIPKVLGHTATELRFIIILFLEYLNCHWCDRRYRLQRTGITRDKVWFKIRHFCKNKALQNIRWGEICHIYSSKTKEISLPNTTGSRHLFFMLKIQML